MNMKQLEMFIREQTEGLLMRSTGHVSDSCIVVWYSLQVHINDMKRLRKSVWQYNAQIKSKCSLGYNGTNDRNRYIRIQRLSVRISIALIYAPVSWWRVSNVLVIRQAEKVEFHWTTYSMMYDKVWGGWRTWNRWLVWTSFQTYEFNQQTIVCVGPTCTCENTAQKSNINFVAKFGANQY